MRGLAGEVVEEVFPGTCENEMASRTGGCKLESGYQPKRYRLKRELGQGGRCAPLTGL